MTTADAFLRDIIAHPDDDTPRLIYADWLEDAAESGLAHDLTRAEFIRAQVELAKVELRFQQTEAAEKDRQSPGWREMVEKRTDLHAQMLALRRREVELRLGARHVANIKGPTNDWLWAKEVFGDLIGRKDRPDDIHSWQFHRGFVAEVTYQTSTWMGERCQACESTGQPYCSGDGGAGRHATQLIRAAPLTRVVLADREPVDCGTGRWVWYQHVGGAQARSELPRSLFDLLAGESVFGSFVPCKAYPTSQSALDALQCGAAIRWAHLAAEQEDVRAQPCTCLATPGFATQLLCDRCKRLRELDALVEGR